VSQRVVRVLAVRRHPGWAWEIPADSDDTAVMLPELTLAERVPRTEARSVACHTVGAHRLRRVLDPGPPWLRRGMFTTCTTAEPAVTSALSP
jgi:hypothetical protein